MQKNIIDQYKSINNYQSNLFCRWIKCYNFISIAYWCLLRHIVMHNTQWCLLSYTTDKCLPKMAMYVFITYISIVGYFTSVVVTVATYICCFPESHGPEVTRCVYCVSFSNKAPTVAVDLNYVISKCWSSD